MQRTEASPTSTRPEAESLIRVDAGGWGLTWVVDELGRLRQVGVGPTGHEAVCDVPGKWYPDAFPTWGGGDPFRPAALRATHSDGTTSTRLVVHAVERTPIADGEHVVVTCRDEELDFTVEHHLRTHPSSAVLEQWVEVVHAEPAPVRLYDYDSVSPLVLITPDAELCQFSGGGWADEWRWSTDLVQHGLTTLASLGGLQPHLQRSPCLLVAPFGPSSEHSGDALGLSIEWGGNIRFDLDVRPNAGLDGSRELRLRAGANPLGADYLLDPGARFVTPTVAWTWSSTGRAAVTRSFHSWSRDRVLRDPQRRRPIVSNNWEATFFDFDEARDRRADRALGRHRRRAVPARRRLVRHGPPPRRRHDEPGRLGPSTLRSCRRAWRRSPRLLPRRNPLRHLARARDGEPRLRAATTHTRTGCIARAAAAVASTATSSSSIRCSRRSVPS